MTRPTTKTIDGYRVQPLLPMSFPYFGVKQPYTLVLTLQQAREADIIEAI